MRGIRFSPGLTVHETHSPAFSDLAAIVLPFELFQTTRLARAMEDWSCQCPRLCRAAGEHLIDVIQVGREFGPLRARCGKIVPIGLEQRFLQIAITQSTSAQT